MKLHLGSGKFVAFAVVAGEQAIGLGVRGTFCCWINREFSAEFHMSHVKIDTICL